ncbi:MAG: hypothetical protein F6K23_05405 [Okeania sp. SIO2C9]|uniref:hypothetical protein n=1 Tax=Okeania sp. SIO2C9 TaxID=2607791 RepID=UPI0013C11769|nr:hypothetical protein [Okeania sp. SIO2C9]NEQ72555.1 hypothetical protein [Okeania sp. SIO2C9]
MDNIKIALLSISGIIGLGSGAFYFLSKQNETETRANIDRWFEERLAISLAEKLGESTEEVLVTLQGASNPIIADKIREIMDSAKLIFTREKSIDDVEIRLNVDYVNGKSFSVATNWNWDELPGTIRSEFIKSDSKTVSFPWYFPWDNQ